MKYIGNIIYDEELLEDGNHFVIFGAGKYGKKILQYMDANKVKKNVICFFITDCQMKKQDMEGIPIININDAAEQYPDAGYLIAGKYAEEMYRILKEKSMKEIHFLFI